jgi:hypothetical protein
MLDLDRNPTDPKWVAAVFAILSMISVSMGGAWAFTNAIAHDYVSVREYDKRHTDLENQLGRIENHLQRMEDHLSSVDLFVHGHGRSNK